MLLDKCTCEMEVTVCWIKLIALDVSDEVWHERDKRYSVFDVKAKVRRRGNCPQWFGGVDRQLCCHLD